MYKPSNEEINRVIAEFMGLECTNGQPWYPDYEEDYEGNQEAVQVAVQPYTESLDALVTVVEKLAPVWVFELSFPCKFNYSGVTYWRLSDCGTTYLPQNTQSEVQSQSPSKALAKAIYEVIKEGENA